MRYAEMLSVAQEALRPEPSGTMADNAFLSRFHFGRVFERTVGEPPGALRRRLLLERAAYELRASETPVTQIALDAGYQSLEGFGRAFKSAFGLAPRAYRRAAQQIRFLPASSGVHYDPKHRSLVTTLPKGQRNMDLIDRLLESDYRSKRRILECARLLSDGQLDAPLAFQIRVGRFSDPPRTLRETLRQLFGNGEDYGWMGAMYDALDWKPSPLPAREASGDSPAAMLERMEVTSKTFREFVQHVRTGNLWDKEWVDAFCEPPETFAVGQVIEESLSGGIALRRVLEIMMEQMGFQIWEMG